MDGWKPILDTFKEYLDKDCKLDLSAHKKPTFAYKEKWGELVIDCRVNFTTANHDVADFCESLSSRVCCECGRTGESRDLPWILTLCDECYKEIKNGK